MSDDLPESVNNTVETCEQAVNRIKEQPTHRLIDWFHTAGKTDGKNGNPHLQFAVINLQLTEIGQQCAKAYHDGVRLFMPTFPEFPLSSPSPQIKTPPAQS